MGNGGADGIFGPITKGAIILFQSNNNLTQTGIINFRTKSLIERYKLGLDYFSQVSAEKLDIFKENNISFICRYHCIEGASRKILTKEETEEISVKGIDIVTVYEYGGANPEHFTYDKGYNDCKEAIKRAIAIEQPYDSAIYFAVDYDMRQRLNDVSNYFDGIKKAMDEHYYENNYNEWNIGVYGGYDVIEHIHNEKWYVDYLWQTIAWSGGHIYPKIVFTSMK